MSNGASEPLSDPRLAYDTAVGLVKLVSQEIYSRFAAMLTLQGFIFAAIGLLWRSSNAPLPEAVALGLSLAGLALCLPWWWFVDHGVEAQKTFRREAVAAEKYFDDSLRIFTRLEVTPLVEEGGSRRGGPRSFRRAAGFIIIVILLMHVGLAIMSSLQLAFRLGWCRAL